MIEDTVSERALLIETPTSIKRSEPEVVWEMERLAPLVVPEETASTSGMLPGKEVAVGVGVSIGVGGIGVSEGVGVMVGDNGVLVVGTGVLVGIGVGGLVGVGGINVGVSVGVGGGTVP